MLETADERAAAPRTQPKARHEDRDHDGDHRGGNAEPGDTEPQPDDFVHKAAEPGDEEEYEKPPRLQNSLLLNCRRTAMGVARVGRQMRQVNYETVRYGGS